jgi:RHS repeat-associated protein
VNSSGAVADHIVTDSFGQVSSQSNAAAQPWTGFGGGHADSDTGDVTNGLRRYDASTGGWTTKDPLGFAGGDANTGRYAGNSPTNAIDPTGLFQQSIVWGVQNGKRRETMTVTDNGATTSTSVDTLLVNATYGVGSPPINYSILAAGSPPGWKGPWGVNTQIQWAQWFAAQNHSVPPPGWKGPWGYAAQMNYPYKWAQWLAQNATNTITTAGTPKPPSIFDPNTKVPLKPDDPEPFGIFEPGEVPGVSSINLGDIKVPGTLFTISGGIKTPIDKPKTIETELEIKITIPYGK